ncbi:MAG: EpsG family protein [Lachnospiraceae bacterium]
MGNVFITIGLMCLPFSLIDSAIQRKERKSLSEKILGKNCFLIICGIILFFSFFRHPLIGTDSINNYNAFGAIANNPEQVNYGIGYIKLVQIFQIFSIDYTVFTKLCTLIIMLPIIYVISKCPYRSFLLVLFALGELNATFDVIKGFISFSFVIVGFYLWDMKGKKIGILLAVASLLFHLSSVFFLVVYIAARIIKSRKIYFIMAGIGIIFVATPFFGNAMDYIISIAATVSSRFLSYIGTFGVNADFSLTYVVIFLIPNALALYYYPNLQFINKRKKDEVLSYKKLNAEDKSIRTCINISWILFIIAIISTWMPVLNRYLKLSLIFTYILFAYCLKKEERLNNRIVLMFFMLLVNIVFAYLNNGGFVYEFLF